MGAASHVLLINFAVLLLAGAGFAFGWMRDRANLALAWTTLGIGLLVAGGVSGVATPMFGAPLILRLGLFTFAAWGMLALSFGLRVHYGRSAEPRTYALGAAAIALVVLVGIDAPRDAQWRFLVLNGPAVLGTVPGLVAILRARERDALDTLLVLAFGIVIAQFVVRGPLAAALGGIGASPVDYLSQPYALAVYTMQTLAAVLSSTALAMVHVRDTVRGLERASEHDPLTGLLNRRGMDAAMPAIVSRKARSFQPVSVVVTDIDHFKAVNDTYGHDAGDRVIRALAVLLRGTARKRDLVARMGGEEFVTVMSDASPDMARLYAEAVRVALAELEQGALGGERVTASFGIAELMPGGGVSEAIAAADMALYEAKRAGRNRVRVARPRGDAWDGRERRDGSPALGLAG